MIHPPADLAERAARQHVVVIGGGVAGLVAARECAKVGMPVTVLERDDAFGGSIRTAELDGLRLDVGAESFATRGGHVRELITELGLDAVVTAPTPGGAWLTGIPGRRTRRCRPEASSASRPTPSKTTSGASSAGQEPGAPTWIGCAHR